MPSETRPSAPALLESVRILAVDDHEANLIALEAALQGMGNELVCVSSGSAAIEQVASREFAAVLMDVQMPGMDGFEAAKRIRALPGGRDVPIIFVTAIYQSEDYMQQGYLEGAVDYLFKPLNMDFLRAKVRVFADLYRKTKAIERHAEAEKHLALQQQENRILKDLLQSRDEFISIASHELKTPLSPLNLNLQAVAEIFESDRLDQVPREKLERMLRSSISQVDRMGRLVNDLLDASRMVEGRFPIERDWCDLAEIVGGLVQNFEAEFNRHQTPIHLESEASVMGRWDRTRLEQVVINLLANALKYGNGKPVSVRVFSSGDEARVVVRDQGIGIAPEDQRRIFNRFERAASTRHFGGLGLGLYIAHRIAELHRGQLWVESELHHGSTFHLALPKDA